MNIQKLSCLWVSLICACADATMEPTEHLNASEGSETEASTGMDSSPHNPSHGNPDGTTYLTDDTSESTDTDASDSTSSDSSDTSISCGTGLLICDHVCTDPQTDLENCGSCGNVCAGNQLCIEGECITQCEENETFCDNQCFDLQSDPENCGACGNSCHVANSTSALCVKGECVITCQDSLLACNGECIYPQTDLENCGGCGNVCNGINAVMAECNVGVCKLECEDGWRDMDQDPSNGCEFDGARVFVTSQSYQGDLGGVEGAHQKCQALADSANLGGTFRAWIGVKNTFSPSTYFIKTTTPIRRVDGVLIAENWKDLVDGELANPISVDENGQPVKSALNVWTNLDDDGIPDVYGYYQPDDCKGWTNNSNFEDGKYGQLNNINNDWTEKNSMPCNQTARLYCFEL